MDSSGTLDVLVYTTVAATTFTRAAAATKVSTDVNPNLAGPSQPEKSKGSDDSFYELPTLEPFEAKHWYVPRWNITNDSLLDDGFSCSTLVDRVAPLAFFSALRTMDYDQHYTEFNIEAARSSFFFSYWLDVGLFLHYGVLWMSSAFGIPYSMDFVWLSDSSLALDLRFELALYHCCGREFRVLNGYDHKSFDEERGLN
ncbi:hypothetical protein Tco_1219106 [Tanacetum coccineum]